MNARNSSFPEKRLRPSLLEIGGGTRGPLVPQTSSFNSSIPFPNKRVYDVQTTDRSHIVRIFYLIQYIV